MTITKTLPWSIALHLLLIGGIVAASGSAMRGSKFLPRRIIVSLEQASPGLHPVKPATKQVAVPERTATSEKTAPADKMEKADNRQKDVAANAKHKTLPATSAPVKTIAETAVQTQAQDPQINSNQPRAALFQNIMMRRNMWMRPHPLIMWRPSVEPNPWLAAPAKSGFLNGMQSKLEALLAEKIKKETGIRYDGTAAKILLSYGPDGKLSGVRISSDSGGLKTLLEGIDWQAVPLPGVYRLSLKGLALNIRIEDGISIGAQAL